jgi:WD40 repeat protein
MNGDAYNMELANMDLKSSLLNEGHQQSYQQHQKLVRTYEEILESELNRANPILKGHTNAVTGIALTSDDSFLISCGKDNALRIWNLIDRVQDIRY